MNNEPVAWMSPEGWAYGKHETRPPECNIPLYTHPAKTLTDEEITYLAKRFEGVWDGAVDYKKFARAILKKASEK
jgi:hypothetical protein